MSTFADALKELTAATEDLQRAEYERAEQSARMKLMVEHRDDDGALAFLDKYRLAVALHSDAERRLLAAWKQLLTGWTERHSP